MKTMKLPHTDMNASPFVFGTSKINLVPQEQVNSAVDAAISCGVNYFDLADIYGGLGQCEEIFQKAIAGRDRSKMYIQSKCGVIRGPEHIHYDFSKAHIIEAVEGSLKRLKTDYLDALLLHRADALMEPEEVAAAFTALEKEGKVRHFGVSNHTPSQVELLKTCVEQPLFANQLQFGLGHTLLVDSTFAVNMVIDQGIQRDMDLLNYCRLNKMTIQAWSPFQNSAHDKSFLADPKMMPRLWEELTRLAEEKNTTRAAIAAAWILRHPANMQVIIGSRSAKHVEEICAGAQVQLSRKEWYDLYFAAGHRIP
ncbi:MAG: aldo/keto reductase [Christensenellaceae bacterium]|nr:aldo/keto reductase [Christensenellaceae bacterium]